MSRINPFPLSCVLHIFYHSTEKKLGNYKSLAASLHRWLTSLHLVFLCSGHDLLAHLVFVDSVCFRWFKVQSPHQAFCHSTLLTPRAVSGEHAQSHVTDEAGIQTKGYWTLSQQTWLLDTMNSFFVAQANYLKVRLIVFTNKLLVGNRIERGEWEWLKIFVPSLRDRTAFTTVGDVGSVSRERPGLVWG